MKQEEKSKAARKAFEAYEKAVAAAQAFIASGPPRGLGTTVMEEEENYHGGDFHCSECQGRTRDKSWKFCAFCGAEIVRFVKHGPTNTIMVELIGEQKPFERHTFPLWEHKKEGHK